MSAGVLVGYCNNLIEPKKSHHLHQNWSVLETSSSYCDIVVYYKLPALIFLVVIMWIQSAIALYPSPDCRQEHVWIPPFVKIGGGGKSIWYDHFTAVLLATCSGQGQGLHCLSYLCLSTAFCTQYPEQDCGSVSYMWNAEASAYSSVTRGEFWEQVL